MSNDYPSFSSPEARDPISLDKPPSYGEPPPSAVTYEPPSYTAPLPQGYSDQPHSPALPPQHPYGSQNYSPGKSTNETNLLILILGLAGFFIPLVSFVAWYMGGKERKAARSAGRPEDSMVTIGWILGILGSVAQILLLIGLFLFVGLFSASFVAVG